MFLKLNAGRLSIPLGYILFFGITLHLTPCVGQGVSDSQLFRDSLYRHISREMSAELSCHFAYERDGSLISANLGGNAAELDRLSAFIRLALTHPDYSVSHIRLAAYSSIEGDYARNETVARERAEYFHAYLQVRYPELYHYPHSVAWVAEDWQGLSKMVRASSINEREEILEIIRKVRVYDDREALLMKLNGGHAYHIMERTMFPQLRRVELQIEYTALGSGTLPPVDPLIYSVLEKDTVDLRDNRSLALAQAASEKAPTTSPLRGTPPRAGSHHPALWAPLLGQEGSSMPHSRFALKTNLLLWAGIQHDFKYTTPVANVALEYYISNHYSIELGAAYSYWRFNSNQEFQGISGYRLESRYRISLPATRERIEIFLGLYGRVGDYDRRSTVNYTGDYWDAGLSAGITINLVAGLGLEIGARTGYVKAQAIKYTMDNQYNWYDSEQKYSKFKVTDLNLNLVYRFR